MVAALARRWWVFLAQGVVMIILALFTFAQPGILLLIIASYAIIDGALKIVSGIGDQPDGRSRWPALVIGVGSVIVGLLIWLNPVSAGEFITYLIAVWAIVVGLLLFVWALRLRQEIGDEWLLIAFGVLSIVFGLLVFNNVLAGFVSLAWIFAFYMIVGGLLAIALSFRIKGIGERIGALA